MGSEAKTVPLCACGQPCRHFEREGFMPAFYSATCGDVVCVSAWEDAHAVPYTDRLVREDQPEPDRNVSMAGVPEALRHHVIGDFNSGLVGDVHRHTFIYGANGTGKSALSVAMLREIGKPRCLWTSAYRILSRIKSTYRRGSGDSEADVMDELVALPTLVIDDLGAEHKSEFGIATLYEVVKERCEAGRQVIVTSNLTLPELDQLEPRLASRFAAFQVIKLAGKDRRVPSKESA